MLTAPAPRPAAPAPRPAAPKAPAAPKVQKAPAVPKAEKVQKVPAAPQKVVVRPVSPVMPGMAVPPMVVVQGPVPLYNPYANGLVAGSVMTPVTPVDDDRVWSGADIAVCVIVLALLLAAGVWALRRRTVKGRW